MKELEIINRKANVVRVHFYTVCVEYAAPDCKGNFKALKDGELRGIVKIDFDKCPTMFQSAPHQMNNTLHSFNDMRSETSSDVAAAILTLANVIENKHYFDIASSENFGHELCLSLRALFEKKSLSVNANVTMEGQ